MTPVGFIAAVPDRRRPAARVAQVDAQRTCGTQFLWPVVGAVAVGGGVAALGVSVLGVGPVFRALRVRRDDDRAGVRARRGRAAAHDGHRLFTALVGLFARSRRRYAGYIVHLGIVLMFLGFAGERVRRAKSRSLLDAGAAGRWSGRYTVTFNALKVTEDGQKQMVTADVEVGRDGKPLGGMYPARWFFRRPRGRADDRGRAAARLRRRPLHRARGLRGRAARRRILQCHDQPARQLDLVRRRHHGHRHDHRAAARARAGVRHEPRAGGRRHDVAHAAAGRWRAAARALHAQHVERPQTVIVVPKTPLENGPAERDRLHVRHAAAASASASARAATPPRCARRSPGWSRRPDPRRDHPVLRERSTAARKCWPRRSTRASTASPGCCRTASASCGIVVVGGLAVALVAPLRRRRRRRRPRPASRTRTALDDELRDSTDELPQDRAAIRGPALLPAAVDGRRDRGGRDGAATPIRSRCCC